MKIGGLIVSATAAGLLVLAGCGAGESIVNLPAKGNVAGVVVVPRAKDDNATGGQMCANLPIPSGYAPLEDANVSYIDENGTVAVSVMTDACGRFYGTYETQGLKIVRIKKAGFHTMYSDFSAFDNGGNGWGIVSTADVNNTFAVRVNIEGESLAYQSKKGNFKYSVIDTKTGRAVLGIARSQVRMYKNTEEANVTDYRFNDLDADLVLTLDASGSMESEVLDQNASSLGTRYDLTYKSAKSFIDELSGNAQLGVNIFDDKIDFIDSDFVNSLKLDGPFVYAKDGFERNKKNSKFIIDIYHPNSHVYDVNSSLIPEYPYMTKEEYKWGGATAYIDAASTAVTKLDLRAAERRIAVLMTDGFDNSSDKTISQVITEAQKAKVTFYTITIGEYIDSNLQKLAKETGGIYMQAVGSDIGDRFSEVLSEIQYFYEIATPIEENTTATYRVDVLLDGETVSGVVELNTTQPTSPLPSPETDGARLYLKCMPCHGVYGEKSAYGVTQIIRDMNATDIKTALEAYKNGSLNQYGWGTLMHDQISTYSDEEIATVSEYIPTIELPVSLADANASGS